MQKCIVALKIIMPETQHAAYHLYQPTASKTRMYGIVLPAQANICKNKELKTVPWQNSFRCDKRLGKSLM
jgi:hypothetical protein